MGNHTSTLKQKLNGSKKDNKQNNNSKKKEIAKDSKKLAVTPDPSNTINANEDRDALAKQISKDSHSPLSSAPNSLSDNINNKPSLDAAPQDSIPLTKKSDEIKKPKRKSITSTKQPQLQPYHTLSGDREYHPTNSNSSGAIALDGPPVFSMPVFSVHSQGRRPSAVGLTGISK